LAAKLPNGPSSFLLPPFPEEREGRGGIGGNVG
jgi:hypothetical protein